MRGLLALVSLAVAASASAEVVVLKLSGEVIHVTGSVPIPDFAVGDSVTMTLTINTDAGIYNDDKTFTISYADATANLLIEAGDYDSGRLSLDALSPNVFTLADLPDVVSDNVSFFLRGDFQDPPSNGLRLNDVIISLWTTDGDFLDDTPVIDEVDFDALEILPEDSGVQLNFGPAPGTSVAIVNFTLEDVDVLYIAGACEGDINGDGVVDFADLNALLSAFGSVCEK